MVNEAVGAEWCIPDELWARIGPLPPPTDGDIEALTHKLARRLGAIARRRLAGDDEDEPEPDALRESTAEALRAPLPRVAPVEGGRVGVQEPKPLCARVDGFSLHAARTVAHHDRQGLERLCRYGMRAPFSLERLTTTDDGQVVLRLLRPWPHPGGRTEIRLAPRAFLRRMAVLVPAPYSNQVRYHGVFANRSRYRPLLPAPPPRILTRPEAPAPPPVPSQPATPPPTPRARRLSWAALLRRTLDVDALACPACGTAMLVLAYLSDPAVVGRILAHLGLAETAGPHDAGARLADSPMTERNEDGPAGPQAHVALAHRSRQPEPRTRSGRAPPRAPP